MGCIALIARGLAKEEGCWVDGRLKVVRMDVDGWSRCACTIGRLSEISEEVVNRAAMVRGEETCPLTSSNRIFELEKVKYGQEWLQANLRRLVIGW